MESTNIVNAIVAGDKESFMQAFNAALANKVTDALEIKKVELATNFIATPEETVDEPTEIQTEVDGSSSDGAESTTDAE